MKRVVLSIIAVAAALVTVSCNKEQAFDSGDIAKVTYTVAGPQMVATKAMGTIGSAYTLYYEVRLWDGENLGNKLTGTGLSGSKTVGAAEWPATVQFDLARGKQYKILFWAQSTSAPTGLFTATDLTAIAIDYDKMAANNENCDAFSGFDVITPSGATAASATLHRPFALVNLGTSDAAQFKTASGGVVVGNVSAEISGDIAKKFNVANGTASETIEAFTAAAAPIDAFDKKTLALSGTDTYNYLSAVYVLPLTASSNIDVEYTIKDSQETPADITSLKVTNVPIKTNYRTNITGKLLTGSTTYNISVDQAFAGNTNKDATPSFSSIAALNTFFASLISTGPNDPDHGDIYPESVTVTAIPSGDATTITLPNDTLSVAINILASYDDAAGLTIAYPTVEGAKHSNKVFFNMAGLKKLTANLPDTHLEVVSGSNIDLSDVHTSASTFVIQKGARVGTANIQQGNAQIAGAVETLNVVPSATADGTAPVQIFLEKESSVEEIVLEAKTDVVVEQPADQIEVEDTEYKVAVYVNTNGCSATAQNGGQIYVALGDGVTSCTVAADGKSNAEIDEGTPSSVKIASVEEDEVTIDASTSDGGTIVNGTEMDIPVKNYVAQIGEKKYETLIAAVAEVPDAAPTTITMIGDDAVENGITIAAEKIIVLELAGHTVSGNTNSASTYALITNRGTLTIQDNTDIQKDGTGKGLLTTYITNADQLDVPGYASNTITNNGTLTVKSGKLVNNGDGYACYAIDNVTNGTLYNPVLKIEGGRMEQMNGWTYAVRMFCNSQTNTNSVEITGGVITGGYGFWLQMPSQNSAPDASLTISGGSIISRDGAAAYIASSYNSTTSRENVSVKISGGTFTGASYGLMVQGVTDGYAGFKEFNISGGIISGIAAGKNLGGFISGGYFGNNPTEYLFNGYSAVLQEEGDWDGWYKVVPAEE